MTKVIKHEKLDPPYQKVVIRAGYDNGEEILVLGDRTEANVVGGGFLGSIVKTEDGKEYFTGVNPIRYFTEQELVDKINSLEEQIKTLKSFQGKLSEWNGIYNSIYSHSGSSLQYMAQIGVYNRHL